MTSVFFSSFRSNILVYLQSFQHLSIEHQWGQLSCNHYFLIRTFSSSSLLSGMTVPSVCPYIPYIDFRGFLQISPSFFKFCLRK